MEIEEETRVQAASPTWFSQRAGRITASNVGPIVNIKKKEITEQFIKKTSLIKKKTHLHQRLPQIKKLLNKLYKKLRKSYT